MPKSLADGRIKLTALPARPTNINAITATEAAAGTDISCDILFSDYSLGPSGSDTIDEKALCTQGNFQALGASNFSGNNISPFRYFDAATKQPDVAEDATFQMMKDKGTLLYLIERESAKAATEDWAEGDEYSYYEVYTDDPQRVDVGTGFIKRRIALAVQNAALNKTIAAGA